MNKLEVEMGVYCPELGKSGVVIPAGPYGDQPYQVRDVDGEVHSFINEDGTCPHTKNTWLEILYDECIDEHDLAVEDYLSSRND